MRISDWSSDVCSSDLTKSGLLLGPSTKGKPGRYNRDTPIARRLDRRMGPAGKRHAKRVADVDHQLFRRPGLGCCAIFQRRAQSADGVRADATATAVSAVGEPAAESGRAWVRARGGAY